MTTTSDQNNISARDAPEAPVTENLRIRREVKIWSAEQIVLPLLYAAAGLMFYFGFGNLFTDTGPTAELKRVLISCAAGLAGWFITSTAIKRLAPMAAIDMPWAGPLALSAITIVGISLGSATIAGNTLQDVEQLRLQESGQGRAMLVAAHNEAAVQARTLITATGVVSSDLRAYERCESQSACLSDGRTGTGPVTRLLAQLASRSASIGETMTQGENQRQSSLAELNRLLKKYNETLAESDRVIWDRRTDLQSIDALLIQKLSELKVALPIAILRGFIQELEAGVTIAAYAAVTTKVNAILRGHASNLAKLLEDLKVAEIAPASFPDRSGVAHVFGYLDHFLFLTGVVFIIELLGPWILWLSAYWILWREVESRDPRPSNAQPQRDGYEKLKESITDPISPAAPEVHANGHDRTV